MKIARNAAMAIIAGLIVGLALNGPVRAQTGQMPSLPDTNGTGAMAPGSMMGSGGMMPPGGMMQMHEKMQADTKAMDDELDALVVKMNHASPSDKADAMAAVITKMAQQRKMTDEKMAAMQTSMMQGMMAGKGGMKMSPSMKMIPPTTMTSPMK